MRICTITSQRLLDQSQAGVYRGKRHIPPHFWPFWGYLRTLPQGVELLVLTPCKIIILSSKRIPQ